MMAGRHLACGLLLTCALGALSPSARADASPDLSAVEDAYRRVDFDAVRQLAHAAIRAGGRDRSSMIRLESLLGIANAALDRSSEAQAAFVRLLAIDPKQRLDRELSPKLRAPYLEARGFWATSSERLSASAELRGGEVVVSLSDPARMISTARVSVREAAGAEFKDASLAASASVRVALSSRVHGQPLELAIVLLDEFGNTLHERGTKLEPVRLEPERPAGAAAHPFRSAPTSPSSSAWLSGTLLALGAASAATGGYFHVQRERAARTWNGSGCEHPGATRAEQCGDVQRRITRDEWLTVGFYTGGAALITLGVVSLVTGSRANSEQGSARVQCDLASAGLWCAGTF